MTFRSKVDTWLGAVLWCCVLLMAACGVFVISIGAPLYLLAVGLPLLIVLSAVCLWVRYATTYSLTEDRLLSVSGPFRRSIALGELVSVASCHSWRPGLALSLDRVKLDYGKHSLLISPENQSEFLAELYRLKPELKSIP